MIVVLDKKYSTNRYLASMSEQQAKRAKMSSGGDWCLIESDPGVFTELIKGFGMYPAYVMNSGAIGYLLSVEQ